MNARPEDLVILIAPAPGSPGGFELRPNPGTAYRGRDIIWISQGPAVTLLFPDQSPFPGVTLAIAAGGQGRLTVSEQTLCKPFNYVVFVVQIGLSLEGDDGNDPTIIIN